MIDINKVEMFKNNLSTLKETSKCNQDGKEFYMTESTAKVINFDGVKNDYVKELSLFETPKSNDALHVNDNGELTFIEFKNGDMSKERFNIRLKIFDSLLILTDIINEGVNFTRSNMNYILVYNEEKNLNDESQIMSVQESVSRTKIEKHFTEVKAGKKFIGFNLERFEKLYFKGVYTYTQKEFEKNFVNKVS